MKKSPKVVSENLKTQSQRPEAQLVREALKSDACPQCGSTSKMIYRARCMRSLLQTPHMWHTEPPRNEVENRRRKLRNGLPMTMRPKTYPLLVRCVESGVEFGWMRAHKHTEHPTSEQIKAQIIDEVLGAICEAFDFVTMKEEDFDG